MRDVSKCPDSCIQHSKISETHFLLETLIYIRKQTIHGIGATMNEIYPGFIYKAKIFFCTLH